MKFHYYRETDSLYIDLSERVSADSREVVPGVVLDFDANGNLVGIDIDHAGKVVNCSPGEPATLDLDRKRRTSAPDRIPRSGAGGEILHWRD